MKSELSLSERWSLPTSKFFAPLVKIGVYVAAASAAIVLFQAQLATAGIPVPGIVGQIIQNLGWISATIAAFSKLTVDFDKVDWNEIANQRALAGWLK